MLPLAILNASTPKARMTTNRASETTMIFAQWARKASLPLRRLLACWRACAIFLSERIITSLLPRLSIRRSQVIVYLRPLKRSREIGISDLRLRIEVVDLPPPFTVSVTGLLDPTEREVRLRPDRRGVHIRDSVVQLVQRPESCVPIA